MSLFVTPQWVKHHSSSIRVGTLLCQWPLPTQVPSQAVEDFAQHLQNKILEARDHICRAQETRAKCFEQGMRPSKLKIGDLVLLSTEHYNLQLSSQKLAPKWLGPLKVLEPRGPNTVRVEIPSCLAQLTLLQNVENLKPYHPCPQEEGPSHEPPLPELVEGEEEFEVEDTGMDRLVPTLHTMHTVTSQHRHTAFMA